MKGYYDLVGDGGSRILEQVTAQRAQIAKNLAEVRHRDRGAVKERRDLAA